MTKLQDRYEDLLLAIKRWLHSGNPYLERAKQETVQQCYFSEPDVQFAVDTLKETLNRDSLKTWIEQSGLSDEHDARGQNILCLHAGNLPLVGMQDILAVLLSGARYTGKISRKEPY